MNDAADSFRALDKLAAKPLVGLPLVTLVKERVTVGVSDASDYAVADTDECERVQY